MNDDIDEKILRRIRALAAAAPSPREHETTRAKARLRAGPQIGLVGGATIIVLVAVVSLARLSGWPGSSGSALASPTATVVEQPTAQVPATGAIGPTAPPGGLSASAATTLATGYAPPNAHFTSEQFGPFGDLAAYAGAGSVSPIAPTKIVWAVQFANTATPCAANGDHCESPRPGTVTVILDYYTGAYLASFGYYPNPQ